MPRPKQYADSAARARAWREKQQVEKQTRDDVTQQTLALLHRNLTEHAAAPHHSFFGIAALAGATPEATLDNVIAFISTMARKEKEAA